MTCIADTPCDELIKLEEEKHVTLPEVVESSTTTTTTTSTSASTTTTEQEEVAEQVQSQDTMGMMMSSSISSNTIPTSSTGSSVTTTTEQEVTEQALSSCSLHSDCYNQLCGLANTDFGGICVDCLFDHNIGCRASETCVISFDTGMPSCQEIPAVEKPAEESSSSTTTTATTTTTTTSTTQMPIVQETADLLPESSTTTTTTTTSISQSPDETPLTYENPPDNAYFCGTTYSSITDMCLQSKPCPSGIAAVHCGEKEGCFAHPECMAVYNAAGTSEATTTPTDPVSTTQEPTTEAPITIDEVDSNGAFSAFDGTEWERDEVDNEAPTDETSFWSASWRDSGATASCAVSLMTVFTSGILLLIM